jgi:hypothetical protein
LLTGSFCRVVENRYARWTRPVGLRGRTEGCDGGAERNERNNGSRRFIAFPFNASRAAAFDFGPMYSATRPK